MNLLKLRDLKTDVDAVLDRAIKSPQYVRRKGHLLVITKAELVPAQSDATLSPWGVRANAVESFYDQAKIR